MRIASVAFAVGSLITTEVSAAGLCEDLNTALAASKSFANFTGKAVGATEWETSLSIVGFTDCKMSKTISVDLLCRSTEALTADEARLVFDRQMNELAICAPAPVWTHTVKGGDPSLAVDRFRNAKDGTVASFLFMPALVNGANGTTVLRFRPSFIVYAASQ